MACESSGSSDLADTGVYLRLYSANGTAFGAATRIDGRLLRNPEVAVSGNGFVVAAHSDAIYAQCVAAGGALAPAFRVADSATISPKIGRESCWERLCMYLVISGGD